MTAEDPVPEKVKETNVVVQASQPTKRSNSTAVMLLSVLSIALLLSTVYLLWLRGQANTYEKQEVELADTVKTNPQTSLSQQFSSFNGDTLVLNDSVYNKPILISNSISLDKDTLYILSRGKIIFKSDSIFKGPALSIPASAKVIIINGMTFDGFDIAIASQSKNVRLEGVQFLNCRVPVQFQFSTPSDSFLNGTLTELFLKKDSLLIPIKK